MMNRTVIDAYIEQVTKYPNMNVAKATRLWHLMKDREKRKAVRLLEDFDQPFIVEDRHDR